MLRLTRVLGLSSLVLIITSYNVSTQARAGPGGVYVIASDGTHLGSIEIGAATGNVAWGEDGSSLFITVSRTVYRLRLTTKGVGF
jgi:sugar lactone lactonase YvrE